MLHDLKLKVRNSDLTSEVKEEGESVDNLL